MIVDDGLDLIRDFLYGGSVTGPTHIVIGTGTTAAAAGDTALETEVFPDGANRNAITSRTKPSAKKVRLQTMIAAGEANGHALTEFGVANAATGGVLVLRVVTATAINKTPAFELQIQALIETSDV